MYRISSKSSKWIQSYTTRTSHPRFLRCCLLAEEIQYICLADRSRVQSECGTQVGTASQQDSTSTCVLPPVLTLCPPLLLLLRFGSWQAMETFNVLIYPWRMLNFLIKLLTFPNKTTIQSDSWWNFSLASNFFSLECTMIQEQQKQQQ